jgi:hypothetical protein
MKQHTDRDRRGLLKRVMVFGLAALILASIAAVPSYAEPKTPLPKDPIVIVTAEPSNEDKDWPIVRIETWDHMDELTGEVRTHRVIVREAPSSYRPSPEWLECPLVEPKDELNCIYRGTQTKTDQDWAGGVTVNLKSWAHKYCRDYDPNCFDKYYALWKSEFWWTRSDPAWTVKNAIYRAGCSGCPNCYTGYVEYPYFQYGPLTPGWNDNNTSWVYRPLLYWPPLMPSMDAGIPLGANLESKAYVNDWYYGNMFVETLWWW